MPEFEPKIVGFLCNWCGYAGADLAGTSRLSYPTNIRIIRVMCSGRVEPAFILNAFENGADGVLVAGCHPGDCHYRSGNQHAEKRIEKTKRLLDLLGIGSDRLRLEWISAAEGEKFASVIKDFTEKLRGKGPNPLGRELEATPVLHNGTESIYDILKRTKALYCQECGKCSSSCPITRLDPLYSPRLAVEKALMGLQDAVLTDKGLWSCLTCYLCRQRCPLDIEYDELIRTCRAKASAKGISGNCAHEGVLFSLSRLMANPETRQNRLGWIPQEAEIAKTGDVLYFAGCLPYFNVVFDDIGVKNIEIAQSMLKILNVAGIKPVLMENERCCGHDLSFAGDLESFEKLAKMNIAEIKKSGVSTVVTTCPECYRTLKVDYAELFGAKLEVLHASEFLSNLIGDGKIKFNGKLAKKVSYQDPCRLGRHMGVYDAPRKVITSIPGVELVEMTRNREGALCCGVSAWMGCGRHSKQMQIERLAEAQATTADLLVTACPKCQIHFNCALCEKLPVKKEEVAIEICDLSVLVARALNLTQTPNMVERIKNE